MIIKETLKERFEENDTLLKLYQIWYIVYDIGIL